MVRKDGRSPVSITAQLVPYNPDAVSEIDNCAESAITCAVVYMTRTRTSSTSNSDVENIGRLSNFLTVST